MHNETIVLEINRINPFGYGMAESGGAVFLVPFVHVGEVVEARVLEKKKDFWICDLIAVQKPSPKRVEPRCEYFQSCGGCDFQHMSYDEQLSWKNQWLADQFTGASIQSILPSPEIYHYRNRMTLHRKGDSVGFFKRNTHDVISIQSCAIANPAVDAKIQKKEFPEGKKFELRADELSGFTQVNSSANAILQSYVRKAVSGKKSQKVLELFSGAGNLSFSIADQAKKIVAIESHQNSVDLAEKRRIDLGIKNIQFQCGDALSIVHEFVQDYQSFDTIISDPPRAGLGKIAKLIPNLGPQKIVCVSCDFFHLKNDIHQLKESGYELKELQPIDMFPQTRHLEVVAILEKS